ASAHSGRMLVSRTDLRWPSNVGQDESRKTASSETKRHKTKLKGRTIDEIRMAVGGTPGRGRGLRRRLVAGDGLQQGRDHYREACAQRLHADRVGRRRSVAR